MFRSRGDLWRDPLYTSIHEQRHSPRCRENRRVILIGADGFIGRAIDTHFRDPAGRFIQRCSSGRRQAMKSAWTLPSGRLRQSSSGTSGDKRRGPPRPEQFGLPDAQGSCRRHEEHHHLGPSYRLPPHRSFEFRCGVRQCDGRYPAHRGGHPPPEMESPARLPALRANQGPGRGGSGTFRECPGRHRVFPRCTGRETVSSPVSSGASWSRKGAPFPPAASIRFPSCPSIRWGSWLMSTSPVGSYECRAERRGSSCSLAGNTANLCRRMGISR